MINHLIYYAYLQLILLCSEFLLIINLIIYNCKSYYIIFSRIFHVVVVVCECLVFIISLAISVFLLDFLIIFVYMIFFSCFIFNLPVVTIFFVIFSFSDFIKFFRLSFVVYVVFILNFNIFVYLILKNTIKTRYLYFLL